MQPRWWCSLSLSREKIPRREELVSDARITSAVKVLASMTKPGLKATSDKPAADYDAKPGGGRCLSHQRSVTRTFFPRTGLCVYA